MNEKQKKILRIFIFFGSAMILSISGIIAFVLYQKQLANNGDVFDKAYAEIHTSWVPPAIAILIGITVAALLLFIGYWKILKTPGK